MAATKTTTGKASTAESVKQLHYLASALKAPRITEAAERPADQARDAGWSFEDYLAAVLEREVSARNASGARLRIRAAGFGASKTLEDFDFDAQPAIRTHIAALASGAFLTEARNLVLLGPPGTGKTHLARHAAAGLHCGWVGASGQQRHHRPRPADGHEAAKEHGAVATTNGRPANHDRMRGTVSESRPRCCAVDVSRRGATP